MQITYSQQQAAWWRRRWWVMQHQAIVRLRLWWARLWTPRQAEAEPAATAVVNADLTDRRYPIPASRAHLYARAADANCG